MNTLLTRSSTRNFLKMREANDYGRSNFGHLSNQLITTSIVILTLLELYRVSLNPFVLDIRTCTGNLPRELIQPNKGNYEGTDESNS